MLYAQNGWLGSGNYLVCEPLPPTGACADYTTLDWQTATTMLYDSLGLSQSDTGMWGGWDAVATCGPEALITDRCCYTMDVSEWAAGRPFTENGEVKNALLARRDDWQTALTLPLASLPAEKRLAVGAAWARMARDEHASIASFAQHILDLTTVGAPAEIIAGATRAMADEIRHAELCFGIASQAFGYPVGPSPIAREPSHGHTPLPKSS